MYQTIILPLAKADINEAARWYNKQQPGLGKRFTKALRAKVAAIKDNPLAYSVRYQEVRTAALDVFPFMVHFIIDGDKILIAAVLHTGRNPLWTDR